MTPARPAPRRPLRRLAVPTLLLALGSALRANDPPTALPGEPTATFISPRLSGPFDPVQHSSPAASHYYAALLPAGAAPFLFLPPDPPPLDTPILLRSPLDTGVSPPSELGAHLYDFFYPQLAARLSEDELPRRLRLKLEAYRELKRTLQNELHDALAAAQRATGDAAPAILADCAQRQAGRLQELEASAEQLRAGLARPRSEWRAAPPPPAPVPSPAGYGTDPQYLRATAYQAEGLSTDQRRLLLSAAAEGERPAPTGSPNTPFYFSPEGASLHLPAEAPPALTAQVAAYTEARRALVRELVAALAQPGAGEAEQLRQLATRQAPAFAALETLATALRQTLHDTPGVDGLPPTPTLPPELAARLASYHGRKQTLLRALNASLTQTVREAARATPNSLAVPVSAFTADQQTEIASLNREKAELRSSLADYHRANGATQDRKSVNTLLEDFERARQLQELREKYRDYRLALLEPGLAPAQRRLLFDTALQALDLPLPFGEPLRQP
jgi:hypothetical protein